MTEAAHDAFLDALVEDDPGQLYEQAPCGFLSTTPEGVIVKVNATLCRWLDTAREDLVGQRSFAELLTPGGQIYHETHYAPMLQMHGTVRELALELRHPDGRRLPVLVNATLVRDEANRPRVIRIAVFDASERRRYEQELVAQKERAEASEARARTLARTLQQTLLPPTEPRVPGLEIATAYRPSGDGIVGGDFYDVFQLGQDEWGVLLGDVCGKDAEAATVTALVRWTLRAAAVESGGTAHALANLNVLLCDHDTERFCTAVLLRLHPDGASWRVTLSVAGHQPPLLFDGSRAEEVAANDAGPLVGVIEDAEFSETDLVLSSGQGLLLYTDGVTDARRGPDFFAEQGLLASVRRHSGGHPRDLVAGLVADIENFQVGPASDDVAVLALRVPPRTS